MYEVKELDSDCITPLAWVGIQSFALGIRRKAEGRRKEGRPKEEGKKAEEGRHQASECLMRVPDA